MKKEVDQGTWYGDDSKKSKGKSNTHTVTISENLKGLDLETKKSNQKSGSKIEQRRSGAAEVNAQENDEDSDEKDDGNQITQSTKKV